MPVIRAAAVRAGWWWWANQGSSQGRRCAYLHGNKTQAVTSVSAQQRLHGGVVVRKRRVLLHTQQLGAADVLHCNCTGTHQTVDR
jgi:hypothetical protein